MSDVLKKAVEALEMARTGLQWYRGMMPEYVDGSDGEADDEINAAIDALSAARQQQSEPVAWRHRFYKGSPPSGWSNWIYTDSKPTREHAEVEPLYTAPPKDPS